MNQDVNRILDTISAEWAQDLSNAKRKIAVAAEENRLLKEKVAQLETELENNKEDEK